MKDETNIADKISLKTIIVSLVLFLSGFAAANGLPGQLDALQHDLKVLEDPGRGEGAERIIMIDVDTLRADRLGYHGYSENTSPFIDSFARNNTAFKNAVTPAPWTRAAQMSVFTGTYPRTHGLTTLRHMAPSRYSMLAEQLNREGYRTAAFTGGHDMKDGVGFEQGFDTYQDYEKYDYTSLGNNLRRASEWMNSTEQKSFVFIHGYDMHDPYGNTEGEGEYSVKGVEGPIGKDRLFAANDSIYIETEQGPRELNSSDLEKISDAYDRDLQNVDSRLEEFMNGLKERGIYENSTIVLYSSHGENLGDNIYETQGPRDRAFGHVYVWRHNIHVPLIIKSPEYGAETINETVSLIDLSPTIREIAGVETDLKARSQTQGVSLIPVIKGEERRKPAFSETKSLDTVAVTSERFQMIEDSGEKSLYPLDNSSFDREEVVSNLSEEIESWRQRTPETYREAVRSDFRSPVTRIVLSVLRYDFFSGVSNSVEAGPVVVEAKGDFTVESRNERRVSGKKAERVRASVGDRKVELEVFENSSREEFERFREQQRREVYSVYRGVVPYNSRPGAEKCGEEYQPSERQLDAKEMTVLSMYADEEGFFGACEDEAEYSARIYIGYCSGSETMYRVSDKVPLSRGDARLGVGCSY